MCSKDLAFIPFDEDLVRSPTETSLAVEIGNLQLTTNMKNEKEVEFEVVSVSCSEDDVTHLQIFSNPPMREFFDCTFQNEFEAKKYQLYSETEEVLKISDEEILALRTSSTNHSPEKSIAWMPSVKVGMAGHDETSDHGAMEGMSVRGGVDDDLIHGQNGSDTLIGLRGKDILMGHEGEDRVYGGRDDDMLFGGLGDDRLRGNLNNDYLDGGSGSDGLFGGGGDDFLIGGEGKDYLLGKNGVDFLDGGVGNDNLTGGLGSDIFAYRELGYGRDLIWDFEIGVDKIDLTHFGFGSFDDVMAHASDGSLGVRIRFSQNDVLFLNDIKKGDLSGGDFILEHNEQTIEAYVSAVRAQSEIHMHGDDMAKMNEHMAAMDLVPRDEATHIAVSDGDWFDTATWHNGQIPGDNAKVLIPEGIEVQYGTVSDTRLFTVRVDGELDFATDLDSRMVFDTMVVSPTGSLVIGSVVDPVGSDVSVELIVADNGPIDVNWDPMLLSRGIVSHGEASIHGAKKDAHDKVIEDPMAGDTSVRFVEVPEGWEVGDKIVIAGTRYEGYKWDTDAGSTIHHAPEDEIRIISAIKDDTVFFEDELVYNHDTPRADLKTSVANYTRNVSIETESADEVEVHERGHVMFMHSDNVDIRYAEFYELGRTDKSELSMQVDDFEAIASDSNVQGRYSLHLHRTGTNDMENPVQVVGNAVWGSPGWGYVHHDSNADLTGNASYNTFGAGYAAETGNETGSWTDNIAIYSKGVSWAEAKNTSKLTDDIFDTGRSGDGFWFQGRLVASSDNVAASVNHGFTYFHRNGDDRMHDVDAAHFEYSGALWDRGDVQANDPPILNFNNNEAFAANQGLEVVKAGSPQSHDVWTHIDGFVAWSVREGVFLEYTSNYLLSDIDIIGKEPEKHSIPNIGIDMGKGTSSIVVIDTKIDGFTKGISFDHRGKIPVEMTKYTVVDTDIINVDDPFPDYLPQYNKITSRSELESYSPDLELDPLYFRANEMELTGTKFDGLGKVSFDTTGANVGQTNFSIKNLDIVKILEEDGYWSTSSGYDYFLLDVYFSDRATGDVYYETHTVELDEFVTNGVGQWWSDYENVSHRGIQDIIISEDGTKMAGTVVLDEAFVAVPFVDAREELHQMSAYDLLSKRLEVSNEQTSILDETLELFADTWGF